jgi:uncharacterized membrane protein
MKEERFNIGEALEFGYCIVVALIFWVAGNILSILDFFILGHKSSFRGLLSLIDFILILFISMAWIQIGLRFTAWEKAGYRDLYAALPHLWHYFLGFLLYVLIVTAGLFLLIVPGIIWAVKYQFFGYFIINQGMTPRQALSRSGKLTKGAKSYLFLFDLTLLGVMLLGTLAIVVGQIIAAPINAIAVAFVYRKFLSTEPSKPENTTASTLGKSDRISEWRITGQ